MKKIFSLLATRTKSGKPVHIETPRLIIREITPADAQRLHEITSAPGFFYCYFDGSRDSVDKFIDRAAETARATPRTDYLLAVVEKSSGKLVGHVSLENEKLLADYPHSFNFFIDNTAQNTGYGKEAAVNLMRYAIEDLGMPGFGVTIHPENGPSLKVAYAQGYKSVGETTLETTRGVEPRLLLVLSKDAFYEQRKHDKVSHYLVKEAANNNRRFTIFSNKKTPGK